jgi:hypothetical protein
LKHTAMIYEPKTDAIVDPGGVGRDEMMYTMIEE